MNILVVGGAGYIGSVTSERLLLRGHDVTVLDNFLTGHRDAVHPEARLIEVDLADAAAVDLAVRSAGFDAVMHFGALIQVGESMTDPGRYFAANITNTINLVNAVVRNQVPRFIFSSTGTVYVDPAPNPITEDVPTGPTNPYSESKLIVEKMLQWYHRIHGLKVGVLRYFNAAGATERLGEDHDPESHLIPNVLKVALGQAPHLKLFGTDYPTPDGTCIRDYIHVIDLAEAHILAVEKLDDLGTITCNLGSENGHSNRSVIETARRVTGRDIPIIEEPRRPGDPVAMVASSARAKDLLSWRPQHASLEAIIGSAWEWRSRHPHGYKRRD